MKGIADKINSLLKFLIVVCLSLMAIFVFMNVVLRYAFNSGITWSEEVSRFLFVWLIFLGAILAFNDNEHLGVDVVIKKLSLTGKKIVYIISNIILLITLVFLLDGSWKLTLLNTDLSAPATGMSYAYIYVFGVIMSAAMILIILLKLYKLIVRKDHSHLIMAGSEDSLDHNDISENGGQEVMTLTVFIVALLGAMALGIPIAFALLISGIAIMFALGNFDTQILAANLIQGADNFPLMAIPFFILAGELMNAGGISKRIIDFAMACVGHVRGGLGYVAIIASVLFAGLSGSAVADTAALGAILIPMMVSQGYNRNRSAGIIAAGGIIAPIIPPSIPMIVFGVTAGVSITKLFMAGIVPGLIIAVALTVVWTLLVRKEKMEAKPRKSAKEILRAELPHFGHCFYQSSFLADCAVVSSLRQRRLP